MSIHFALEMSRMLEYAQDNGESIEFKIFSYGEGPMLEILDYSKGEDRIIFRRNLSTEDVSSLIEMLKESLKHSHEIDKDFK